MPSPHSWAHTPGEGELGERHERAGGASWAGPVALASAFLSAMGGCTPAYFEQRLFRDVAGVIWAAFGLLWMVASGIYVYVEVPSKRSYTYADKVRLGFSALLLVAIIAFFFGAAIEGKQFVLGLPLWVTLLLCAAHAALFIVGRGIRLLRQKALLFLLGDVPTYALPEP